MKCFVCLALVLLLECENSSRAEDVNSSYTSTGKDNRRRNAYGINSTIDAKDKIVENTNGKQQIKSNPYQFIGDYSNNIETGTEEESLEEVEIEVGGNYKPDARNTENEYIDNDKLTLADGSALNNDDINYIHNSHSLHVDKSGKTSDYIVLNNDNQHSVYKRDVNSSPLKGPQLKDKQVIEWKNHGQSALIVSESDVEGSNKPVPPELSALLKENGFWQDMYYDDIIDIFSKRKQDLLLPTELPTINSQNLSVPENSSNYQTMQLRSDDDDYSEYPDNNDEYNYSEDDYEEEYADADEEESEYDDDYILDGDREQPEEPEISYDFNTLNYPKFNQLKTNDFDKKVLGIYGLKLAYYVRNNMINLLGFVMQQSYQDIGQEIYLKLHTLKEGFRQNLINTFKILPTLSRTFDKDANTQMTQVLESFDSHLNKENCHLGCSAEYIKTKLNTKEFDMRRIIAHLAYNPLTHNVYDRVSGEGVTEVRKIARKIGNLDAEPENSDEIFNSDVRQILNEIKEGKMLLSSNLVGFLISFYPWPSGDFKVTHALDQILLVMANENEYMTTCKIIPDGDESLVDHPIEFLTWALTKILDNSCFEHLHVSAKTLMEVILNNRLMGKYYDANPTNNNFVELNALNDLLDIISFEKFPLEIVLARDRIRVYFDKIIPFINMKNCMVYNHRTAETKLHAFLSYLLQQTPYIQSEIRSSILAIQAHLVFQIKPPTVRLETLIEITDAWLAPDLLQEVQSEALGIREYILDNQEKITKAISSNPLKKCVDVQTCIVIGRELLGTRENLTIPKCMVGRFLRESYNPENEMANFIDLLATVNSYTFMKETVSAAEKIRQYFQENQPILKDVQIQVTCTNLSVLLQLLNLILEKLNDIPIDIEQSIKAVIAELEFKIIYKDVSTKVIYQLKSVYENTKENQAYMSIFQDIDSFIMANEDEINKVLLKINPNKCRELFGCYNLIVDYINEADFGYKMPYLYPTSPELSDLNLNQTSDLKKLSVNTIIEIVDLIDEENGCSNEIVASKRYLLRHEKELDSLLKEIDCEEATVIECFGLIREILLFKKNELPNVKLNALQFILQPTYCGKSTCKWIPFAEEGSVILNPLFEYLLEVIEEVADDVPNLHVQLDFFGLLVYLRTHNVNKALEEYKLRKHVVDQTTISTFLDMVSALPYTSKDAKISIDNVNRYLGNQTAAFRGNLILLTGLGKLLMKSTTSVEAQIEIEHNLMQLTSREDDVTEIMNDLIVDCEDLEHCVFEIISHFENRTEFVPKRIYRVVSPSACTVETCSWLSKPPPEKRNVFVSQMLDETYPDDDFDFLEKLTLQKMNQNDMAFELNEINTNNVDYQMNPSEYQYGDNWGNSYYQNEYNSEYTQDPGDAYYYDDGEYNERYDDEEYDDADAYNYNDYEEESQYYDAQTRMDPYFDLPSFDEKIFDVDFKSTDDHHDNYFNPSTNDFKSTDDNRHNYFNPSTNEFKSTHDNRNHYFNPSTNDFKSTDDNRDNYFNPSENEFKSTNDNRDNYFNPSTNDFKSTDNNRDNYFNPSTNDFKNTDDNRDNYFNPSTNDFKSTDDNRDNYFNPSTNEFKSTDDNRDNYFNPSTNDIYSNDDISSQQLTDHNYPNVIDLYDAGKHRRTKRIKRQDDKIDISTPNKSNSNSSNQFNDNPSHSSIFELEETKNADKFEGSYDGVFKNLRMGKLNHFNVGTLSKLMMMIDSNVRSFHVKKLIALLYKELEKNVGETNYYLSQFGLNCVSLRECLWSLNDAILNARLESKPVFFLILQIIRAEGCPVEMCRHKIEVNDQQFFYFVRKLLNQLETLSNPQSNSFHFEMDMDFVISFLKKDDVLNYLPKSLAYNYQNEDLVKNTLVTLLTLNLDREVSESVRNILNMLYKGISPRRLHSENILYLNKVLFSMTNEAAVARELLIQRKEMDDKRMIITEILSKIDVNCVTVTTCVQSLENKLLNQNSKIAKILLRSLRPKSCSQIGCPWLNQTIEINDMQSLIMEEWKKWYDNCKNYLIQIELQQIRYVIIAENLVANFLTFGGMDYDSPLLGILITLNPKIKAKYDLIEGAQMLINFMLKRILPNKITYRQLKHICQKLMTQTDHIPAINSMSDSLYLFPRNMFQIKRKLQEIEVRCVSFAYCVDELSAILYFNKDKASKLIMDVLSPKNCPERKCKWLAKKNTRVPSKAEELSKIEGKMDENTPLIIELKIKFLKSKVENENLYNDTSSSNQTESSDDYDSLLKIVSSNPDASTYTLNAARDVVAYKDNGTVPNEMHVDDFLTLFAELIDMTESALVKAAMNIGKNMFVRYKFDIEAILTECIIKCESLKDCVDDVASCGRKSKSDNADLIAKFLNPIQCISFEVCPWLSKITHEESMNSRVLSVNRNRVKGTFPHDLIIFPPPNEFQQAITFSLSHPNHIKNLVKIFPAQNDPEFGKQLTVLNVNNDGNNHIIVFDFSIPNIFPSLQKVSGLRKPTINLRTFTECIIFIPLPNNEMRALRFDFTIPGVGEKLVELSKMSKKTSESFNLKIIDFNQKKYVLYIDIYNQMFMNKLLECTVDRHPIEGQSVLIFPGNVGEPWKALTGNEEDASLWNVLDLFSTVTIDDKLETRDAKPISNFKFDVYNPSIATHLDSLWRYVPQLDSRLDIKHTFYFPYENGEFSSLTLDLTDPFVVRKFEKISRKFDQTNHSALPTFQIIGNDDYSQGLNVSLNFDKKQSIENFLSIMTTTDYDDANVKITNVGIFATPSSYIALLWDLPVIVSSVQEIGIHSRFFMDIEPKTFANVEKIGTNVKFELNFQNLITQKLLRSIALRTSIYFVPTKVKVDHENNLFVMGAIDPESKKTDCFVIQENEQFFKEISKYNISDSQPKERVIEAEELYPNGIPSELWLFAFEDKGDVIVNASQKQVYKLLKQTAESQEPVSIENVDEHSDIILDFSEESYNYVHLSTLNPENIETLKNVCTGDEEDTVITFAEAKLNCDLNNNSVVESMKSVITRVQTLAAANSIVALQIPDRSGKLHPFIIDLNREEVKKTLRTFSKSIKRSSTNKVAIYYMDKYRIPEVFVLDLETIQLDDLKRLMDYTPCDLIPTSLVNPRGPIDLLAFTIPTGDSFFCNNRIPIILDFNDDLTTREIVAMESANGGNETYIPVMYKNGFKKFFNVPYMNNINVIRKLRRFTSRVDLIKTPVMNLGPILALEIITKDGKYYTMTFKTTSDETILVLSELSKNAEKTIPTSMVRGPNGKNFEIRLDLDDEDVQEKLSSVAVTVMHNPYPGTLLILKPKQLKTPIILNTQNEQVVEELFKLAEKNKRKLEHHVISLKDPMGNTKLLKVDLESEDNLKVLAKLELIDVENTGPVLIPGQNKPVGSVAFRIIDKSGNPHNLLLNVSNSDVAERLAELHDPSKERTQPIPIYDDEGNELLAYVDLWDEDILKVLETLTALSEIDIVKESSAEDDGMVIIPLEITETGAFVIQCNITNPEINKKLFELPGVLDGGKNLVYVPEPSTKQLIPLYFNPYDEALVKSLRELCLEEKFINSNTRNLLINSFEDDCDQETVVLDLESQEVQELFDKMKSTKAKSARSHKRTKKQKVVPYHTMDGKRQNLIMDYDDENQREMMRKAKADIDLDYMPFIANVNGKKNLIVGLDMNGTNTELSFNIDDQNVVRALEELDALSNGVGTNMPIGPYKILTINVGDSRIMDKLIAIYTLFGENYIHAPSVDDQKQARNITNTVVSSIDDGSFLVKTAITTEIPTFSNIEYESYDKPHFDENDDMLSIAMDAPDLIYEHSDYAYDAIAENNLRDVVTVLPENGKNKTETTSKPNMIKTDFYLHKNDLRVDSYNDLVMNDQLKYALIDPAITPGNPTIESTTSRERLIEGDVEDDRVLEYIPSPGSLNLIFLEIDDVVKPILLDTNQPYVRNTLRKMSRFVDISEATHLFLIEIDEQNTHLIKLNCNTKDTVFTLIQLSKATKEKIIPTEFPKPDGGYFLIFTILDPSNREERLIVLDVSDKVVGSKINALASTNPIRPVLLELVKPESFEEIIIDISDPNTIRELISMTENVKYSKDVLKNYAIINGIFSHTITVPIAEGNEYLNNIYNVDDSEVVDDLIVESKEIPEDEVSLVQYVKKKRNTIPIRVNIKKPPSVRIATVFNEIHPQDALIFVLPSSDGVEIVLLDKQNSESLEKLNDLTKKRLTTDSMKKNENPFTVFNILNEDGFPLEIRLDLEDEDDLSSIKELGKLTKQPIAPFEITSPLGYRKLIICSIKVESTYKLIALNPNDLNTEKLVKELFNEFKRDVFSIILDNKDKLFEESIAEAFISNKPNVLKPQQVPFYDPTDYLYFSIIDDSDNRIHLYVDINDPATLERATKISTEDRKGNVMEFLVFDSLDKTCELLRIDVSVKENVIALKELSTSTSFPTIHEIYSKNAMDKLYIYSIPNYEVNYNLTVDPTDERVNRIIEHNLRTLPSSNLIKIKFPTKSSGSIAIPLKKEDFQTISSQSRIQINPLVIIPCNSRGPLLNVMIPKDDSDWISVTIDTNQETIYDNLKKVASENNESSHSVVFYIGENDKTHISVDFSNTKTIDLLSEITSNSSISVIWRRYKKSVIKICSDKDICIYLDLQLEQVRNELISMSRKSENEHNMTQVWFSSAEGFQQKVVLPFLNPEWCDLNLENFPDLKSYQFKNPIPDYYVTIQNNREYSQSPVKIMLANQKYPIMIMDFKNILLDGNSIGDVTIDLNNPNVMEIIENQRNKTKSKEIDLSLFEIQDVEGNIFSFGFNFNEKPDVDIVKNLNSMSLIQFKSRDLSLPSLIIDLINEDLIELDLNLESNVNLLKEASLKDPNDNCYKIEIPQVDDYLILYVDFFDIVFSNNIISDEDDLKNKRDGIYMNFASKNEQQKDIVELNYTDIYGMTWGIDLCLNDFYTVDTLIGLSVKNPRKFTNYVTLGIKDNFKQSHQLFLNQMDISTLQNLKELTLRCTGRQPDLLKYHSLPKYPVTIDYTNSYGRNNKFILDLNNPKILNGIEDASEMSNNMGTQVSFATMDGNNIKYNINFENPFVKKLMYKLRDQSLWGGGYSFQTVSWGKRKKREVFTLEYKHKPLWNVIKIKTPQIGILHFNVSADNMETLNLLEYVRKDRFSVDGINPKIGNVVNQLFSANNSIRINIENPIHLRDLLILNRNVKKLNFPKMDIINKILFRYQTILISDRFEKHMLTIDTYNQHLMKRLGKFAENPIQKKLSCFEYFSSGKLIKTCLDTKLNNIKSILHSSNIQTTMFRNIQQNEANLKTITIIFLKNFTKPIVIDLAKRDALKHFIDISVSDSKLNETKNQTETAYFEIQDDFGTHNTINVDFSELKIKNRLIKTFGLKERIKIIAKNKTYIEFCFYSYKLKKYLTHKIPVTIEGVKKTLEFRNKNQFTINFIDNSSKKSFICNLNPKEKNLYLFLSQGFLIEKSDIPLNLWSIYYENLNKFFDVDLKNAKAVTILKNLTKEIDLNKPTAVVKTKSGYFFVNLNAEIIKLLKTFVKTDIGERNLIYEHVEKQVEIKINNKSINLDLGDSKTIENLEKINQEFQHTTHSQPTVIYNLDDAWKNNLELKFNPSDNNIVNKIINLGV